MVAYQSVEIDGLTFRCKVDGDGGGEGNDKPWIMFSNSLLTDLSVWDAQVAALEGKFRILRYDQRGHGGTGVPDHACTFDELGQDALALMDHFGVKTCTFVGLSMGVPTALWLVASHADRIERLVLSDGQSQTAAAVPLEGYVACIRALQDYQYSHVLDAIDIPTLIVAGANDGNMPVSMCSLRDAIKSATMQIIPDAGHIPNVEQAEIFNRHLGDFLA